MNHDTPEWEAGWQAGVAGKGPEQHPVPIPPRNAWEAGWRAGHQRWLSRTLGHSAEPTPPRPTFEQIGRLLALQAEAGVMSTIPDTSEEAEEMINRLVLARTKVRE